jgi:hypothetical protein
MPPLISEYTDFPCAFFAIQYPYTELYCSFILVQIFETAIPEYMHCAVRILVVNLLVVTKGNQEQTPSMDQN